ncbi:hypothetical protein BDV37DRAFT_252293 [Aspergillus pseudonomiae]|uniref:N-acetylmuramoyl-L-alanine amidase domain-containing protein n=1 Tax=Aspergillus pseudonomiae TaxID=1506151 RepID=A0A5N7D8H3_9EURO|nr:uncharacterized protein BDV37DRAFT_252293 [Aspergillus pseudonomiae]KAE8402604.1 hypothetical protein BDV37DRAFT_252293 [Aspergillus pseudonomiae]
MADACCSRILTWTMLSVWGLSPDGPVPMELSHVLSSRLAWTMARGLNPSKAVCGHMQVETTNPCGTIWNLSTERVRSTCAKRMFKNNGNSKTMN